MGLSQDLARRLTERYVTRERVPREPQLPIGYQNSGIGGEWFCPGCGSRTQENVTGIVRCDECGRCLNEFIGALMKVHPHARVER